MNLPMKQKQIRKHREQTCGCHGGGMEWEFGVNGGKLLHIEWITIRFYCIAQGTIFCDKP